MKQCGYDFNDLPRFHCPRCGLNMMSPYHIHKEGNRIVADYECDFDECDGIKTLILKEE